MVNSILQSSNFMKTGSLSIDKLENKKTESGSESLFSQMLNSMNTTQNNAQNSVYNLLTTGEGDASQVLLQLEQAKSQMKTASVIRDDLVQSYKQLMNTQM